MVPDPTVGDYRDLDDLRAVADGCAVVTFDHEHVPTEHLHALTAEGHACRPGPEALVHAQDKGVMRARLDAPRRAQPAAPAGGRRGRGGDVRGLVGGFPVVLKTTRGGYDGKGVWVVASADDCADAFAVGRRRPASQILAEEKVDFRRELSALVARSPSRAGRGLPGGRVGPARRHLLRGDRPRPRPRRGARRRGAADRACGSPRELDVTGILAVELFETRDGRVLVNELAMRPHNTGHWTHGRRRHRPVREPPARRARPAARLARRRGPVDGDGQHPRRRATARCRRTCTAATRTCSRATRASRCTCTART